MTGIELTEKDAKRRMNTHKVVSFIWLSAFIVVLFLKGNTPYIMTMFAFLYLLIDEALNAVFYFNIYRSFQKSSEAGGARRSNDG